MQQQAETLARGDEDGEAGPPEDEAQDAHEAALLGQDENGVEAGADEDRERAEGAQEVHGHGVGVGAGPADEVGV